MIMHSMTTAAEFSTSLRVGAGTAGRRRATATGIPVTVGLHGPGAGNCNAKPAKKGRLTRPDRVRKGTWSNKPLRLLHVKKE